MKHVLVATDFSQAAENANSLAASIAQKAHLELVLLHVLNNHTDKFLKKSGQKAENLKPYMQSICDKNAETFSIPCRPLVHEGSIFNEINLAASDPECEILIMGTHGSKGLRQTLFGADLLKIAKKCLVPVMATPSNARTGHDGIQRILFPYGGREKFDEKLRAVSFLAKLFDSEVIMYKIDREGAQISDLTRRSIEQALEFLDESGIRHQHVRDKMTKFSVGLATQTLAYAKENDIQVIAVFSTPGEKLSFISEVDKEALINNDAGISILLTADLH